MLSSVNVQEYAAGAASQGAEGIGKLSCGAAQNAPRALINVFGLPKGAPPTTWASIPMKGGRCLHPFFLPHHWFQSLHASNRQMWVKIIRGSESAALDFWRSQRDTPFVLHHPNLPEGDWHKTTPWVCTATLAPFLNTSQYAYLLGTLS